MQYANNQQVLVHIGMCKLAWGIVKGYCEDTRKYIILVNGITMKRGSHNIKDVRF